MTTARTLAGWLALLCGAAFGLWVGCVWGETWGVGFIALGMACFALVA